MSQKSVGHNRRFLDSLRLFLKAGRGGNGYPKFGGVGGRGGDIYVEGNKDITLLKIKNASANKRWKADDGEHSRNLKVLGSAGKDKIIPVPLGTTIKTDFGNNLGEIVNEGDKVLVARGGSGGHPSNNFGGQPGECHHIRLLLKLIADIGLVGFPNAGKSTFLRAISKARPKVASYPFTTLHPTIGILKYEDLRQIAVADLPGLIEGAWCNKGMGHMFLRHVERTKLLLFVVDIEGFRLGPEYPFRSPIENVILLNKELELYQPELVEKPAALLINKIDKPKSEEKVILLKEQLRNIKVISSSLPENMQPERFVEFGEIMMCSAKCIPESVKDVKNKLRRLIDIYDKENDENTLIEVHNKIKAGMYEKSLIKLV